MNKRTIAAMAASASISTLALLPASTASADTRPWTCEDGGHTLTNTIHFASDATSHSWRYLTYKLTGAGTGGKSNWNATFNDGTGVRSYAADNQDDLDQNTLYTEDFVNFNTPSSRVETWRAEAAFDTAGTDNHCASSTVF